MTENALPQVGMPLDARHFSIGQFVTVSGKSIDWGFQGGMHRWGMRGQPSRRYFHFQQFQKIEELQSLIVESVLLEV